MNNIEKVLQQRQQYNIGLKNAIDSAIETGNSVLKKITEIIEKSSAELVALRNKDNAEIIKQITNLFEFLKLFLEFEYQYAFPAASASLYKLINDPKLRKQWANEKGFQKIPLTEIPNLENIFEGLLLMEQTARDCHIANLQCSTKTKIELSTSLNNQDKEAFVDCIYNSDINIDRLKHITDLILYVKYFFDNASQIVELQPTSGISLTEIPNIIMDGLPCNAETHPKAQQFSMISEFFESLQKIVRDEDFSKIKDIRMSAYHLMAPYQMDRYCYKEERLNYSSEEQVLFDKLYVEDTEIELYKEAMKDGYSYTIVDDEDDENINSNRFTTLDNPIFSQEIFKDKTLFFTGLHPNIVAAGDDKFKEFVDYIANSGYIDNTDEAKQLFIFRLTGRCKPNGELPKLLWDGREKQSPNELIFIIRFATDEAKNKYSKMREFFEGPIFPNNNTSGYADQARIEFREKLCEFYPNVFRIKDISQY